MSQFDSRGIPVPHFPIRPRIHSDIERELERLRAALAQAEQRLARVERCVFALVGVDGSDLIGVPTHAPSHGES